MKTINLKVIQKVDDNKKLVSIEYRNSENQLHNEFGLALIEYHKNGNSLREFFYLNGKIHNEKGAATISYYENGNKYSEMFRLNGYLHNENGPAYISYYPNGKIESEEYHLNGKEFSKKEWEERTQKQNSFDGTIINIDGKKYKISLVDFENNLK